MLLSLLFVLISGIALPVGGIQMQYLWRNQLGDVYSLGLGSAACLGAAAATMSGWCSLTVGSFVCTLVCTLICFFVTLRVNTQQLITFGILFGTFIGSLGTIVVTNAPTGDLLKQYYLWGAANFRLEGVTTGDIFFSLALFARPGMPNLGCLYRNLSTSRMGSFISPLLSLLCCFHHTLFALQSLCIFCKKG